MTTPSPHDRDHGPPEDLLGQQVLDAYVPTAVAESGPRRQVLRAEPVDGHAHVLVHLVRLPDHQAAEHRETLERARSVRSDHVLRLLMHGSLPDGRTVLVTPSPGATSLATRLATRPPALVELLAMGAQVARALHAVHDQGRPYGPLTPEHVLIAPGADGDEVVLLPVWWAWRHGLDAAPARPWCPPEALSAPTAASDAWCLGALLWHGLTGAPPREDTDEDLLELPLISGQVRRGIPPALDDLVAGLMAVRPQVRDTALDAVALHLEDLVHQLSGGGPGIAPPMLLSTPVPVGGQLRQASGVLPVPPPPATEDPPPPRRGALQARPSSRVVGAGADLSDVPTVSSELDEELAALETDDEGDIDTVQDRAVDPSLRTPTDTLDLPEPESADIPTGLVRERRGGPGMLVAIVASVALAGVAVLLVLYLLGVLG